MQTKNFIWMFFALMLGVSTVFAQGGRNINRPGYGYGAGGYGFGYGPGFNCVNFIPGLTEEQRSQITELTLNHQKAMTELVIKQRSTFDLIEKNEIRGEMLKKVAAHRDAVRNLLNEEQQQQFDLIQSRNMYGAAGFGRGRRGGRGRAGNAGWRGRGPNCRFFYDGGRFRRGW